MTFAEIFDQDGLYTAKGFQQGFAYKIRLGGLTYVNYNHPDDEEPSDEDRVKMYKDFLDREYTKVENVSDLFA